MAHSLHLSGMQLVKPVHAFIINEEIFPFAKNFKTLADVVNTVLPNLFLIAGLGILVIGVVAGFRVITGAGSGDAKAAEQGKRALTYAIAGIVIIFTSLFVVQLIELLTGINILKPTL